MRAKLEQGGSSLMSSINTPIIFVAGTSGCSLDTSGPFRREFPGDVHTFPEVCETCLLGVATHAPEMFDYRPGPFDITKPWAYDPAGPRVWIGPEAVATILSDTVNTNRGNHYFDVLQFDSDGHNTLFPQIGPGSVLLNVNLGPGGVPSQPIYETLINFLTNVPPNGLGRPLNSGANGVYLFPYDWRADMTEQASSLGKFVDQVLARPEVQAAHVKKVVLLTHSLGGPVGRAYYLSAPEKVEQMISLGGGFGGVVLPLKILVMGDTWGYGLAFGAVNVGFAEWLTQALAQNWGTAYFQLPNSELWFADDGHPFDRSYIRDDRQPLPHAHQASMSWISLYHNATVAKRAEQFFSGPGPGLGDFRGGTGSVPHHRIISKGRMDTVVAIHVYTGMSDECQFAIEHGLPVDPVECVPITRYEPIFGDGDSVVPYHGLLGSIGPSENRVYILDNINDHVEHFAMTTRPEVHHLIGQLLDGSVTNQTQVAGVFKSPDDVQEQAESQIHMQIERGSAGDHKGPHPPPHLPRPYGDEGSHAAASATLQADRWLLRVRGPVEVEIVDEQGRRVGPYLERKEDQASLRLGWLRRTLMVDEGQETSLANGQPQALPQLYEISIPGASYNPGRNFTTVFLTQPGIYTCRCRARILCAVDVYWTPFHASSRLQTIYYQGVLLRPQNQVQWVFNTANIHTAEVASVVPLDKSGGYTSIGEGQAQAIAPTAILEPHESLDTLAPQTTISFQDDMVVISAMDPVESSLGTRSSSGVLRTYYTTDARTFSMYRQPFLLPADAKTVMAFSIDRNGNCEYPGVVLPVLGLSETQLTFRATAGDTKVVPQVVHVRNLEPIGVTGELTWVVTTDVPWLIIDKQVGQTPDMLTIAVDIGQAGTEPGTYTGNVVVSSSTPGVVYAERVVPVVLEVEAG